MLCSFALALLAGCSTYGPGRLAPGQNEADARRELGEARDAPHRVGVDDEVLPQRPARRDAVRVEEFVNYFEQGYKSPREGLDVSIDAAALPFRDGHRLARVGISSAAANASPISSGEK